MMERDVAVCGREIGELKKKLDNQAAILQQMQSMNTNIAVLAEQVRQLAEATGKLDQRLDAVEDRPARRWDVLIVALITAGAGAIIGMLVK